MRKQNASCFFTFRKRRERKRVKGREREGLEGKERKGWGREGKGWKGKERNGREGREIKVKGREDEEKKFLQFFFLINETSGEFLRGPSELACV